MRSTFLKCLLARSDTNDMLIHWIFILFLKLSVVLNINTVFVMPISFTWSPTPKNPPFPLFLLLVLLLLLLLLPLFFSVLSKKCCLLFLKVEVWQGSVWTETDAAYSPALSLFISHTYAQWQTAVCGLSSYSKKGSRTVCMHTAAVQRWLAQYGLLVLFGTHFKERCSHLRPIHL